MPIELQFTKFLMMLISWIPGFRKRRHLVFIFNRFHYYQFISFPCISLVIPFTLLHFIFFNC